MQQYVCGFAFDEDLRQVILIWKEKPVWQKGKLNGIGGKVEDGELPLAAMRREFKEETGLYVHNWEYLITLSGEDWTVYFYCSKSHPNFEYAKTQEIEEVAKIPVDRFLMGDWPHISNLGWLIPMAIHRLEFPLESISITKPT